MAAPNWVTDSIDSLHLLLSHTDSETFMKDVDGNEVNIGDTVKVLHISDNIKDILAEDEVGPTLAMRGGDFEIDEIVNENTQVSVSYQQGCLWGGLYLFPNEFRLVKRAKT